MEIAGGKKPSIVQSSIRSFFQPRVAGYTPPPSTINTNPNGNQILRPVSLPTPTIPKPPEPKVETTSSQPPANPLPRQASISKIDEKHVKPLRHINSQLLPVSYPDSFYREITENPSNFSRVIIWQDSPTKSSFQTNPEAKVVGGIVGRLELNNETKRSAIYIRSLSLLSPYRSYGLATAALEAIIKVIVALPTTHVPITSLYAHVWTENHEALEWYTKRGFVREEPVVAGYYKRLQPGDAWVMRRELGPTDHIRHGPTAQQAIPAPAPTPIPSIISNPPSPLLSPISPATDAVSPSYQTTGPGYEWNDLPADILPPPNAPADYLRPASGNASGASSRSSSSTRNGARKKKREYPAAAFTGVGS